MNITVYNDMLTNSKSSFSGFMIRLCVINCLVLSHFVSFSDWKKKNLMNSLSKSLDRVFIIFVINFLPS